MIDIKILTNEDIGKWVIYTNHEKQEEGRIKSWNSKFIFVVYKCNNNWDTFQEYTAAATDPKEKDRHEDHGPVTAWVTRLRVANSPPA